VLKGALLFELWTKDRHRPTRDVDFLAYGSNDFERFIGIFREICSDVFAEDGLTCDVEQSTESGSNKMPAMRAFGSSSSPTWAASGYLSRLTLASAMS
jgi:hypothetical protein